jgi:hypothetical protein
MILICKKIKGQRFLLAFVTVIMLTGFSYLVCMSAAESTRGCYMFEVFRFPTHTLIWSVFNKSSTLYRLGLVINIFFWTFILERLIMITAYALRNMTADKNASQDK